jgi:hypothetical protein
MLMMIAHPCPAWQTLKENPDMGALHAELVPQSVSYEAFWSR